MSAEYVQGADLPDLTVRWEDTDGNLIDFSTGHTFTLKVGRPNSAAEFTKTSGIEGLDITAATADSPNLRVTWATSGELNTLGSGSWTVDIIATRTADSKHRHFRQVLKVLPAIT